MVPKKPNIFDPSICSEELRQELLSEIKKEGSQVTITCTHLNSKGGKDNTGKDVIDTVGSTATAAGMAGVAVPTVATGVLSSVGFTSSGVAAGSAAAAIQASIGNVAAGSAFATFQSIGATGGFAILGPLGIAAAAVVGTGVLVYKLTPLIKALIEKEKMEKERKKRIQEGTAILGVDLCKRCWIKMKLRHQSFNWKKEVDIDKVKKFQNQKPQSSKSKVGLLTSGAEEVVVVTKPNLLTKYVNSRTRTPSKDDDSIGSKTIDEEYFSAREDDDEDDTDDRSVCDNIGQNHLDIPAGAEAWIVDLLKECDTLLDGDSSSKHEAFKKLESHKDQLDNFCGFWWRFAQATHIEAAAAVEDQDMKKNLTFLGCSRAERALDLNESSANAHKWYAITLVSQHNYVSTNEMIMNVFTFKEHVDQAIQINPEDPILYTLLGRFWLEVSQLSSREMITASTLYCTPSTATARLVETRTRMKGKECFDSLKNKNEGAIVDSGSSDSSENFKDDSIDHLDIPTEAVPWIVDLLKECDTLSDGDSSAQHEAYIRLQRFEDQLKNVCEFWWRFAKATHIEAAAVGADGDEEMKKELSFAACSRAEKALELNDPSANAHKWYAITLGCTRDYVSKREKLKIGYTFKEHVEKAIKITPEDPELHYLLGRFCFDITQLSWTERMMASTMFPNATLEEALKHFEASENLGKPLKENRLHMAKCYIVMKDYEKAAHFLQLAVNMPFISSFDQPIHDEAVKLLGEYRQYLPSGKL